METKNLILLVDDNKSFREGLSISLKDEGYSVIEAENGTEAIELIKNTPPDIVLADIRMPGMDGIELLRRIKETESVCPVIIMTAHASIDVAVDAMRYGAFDFIEKPFRVKELDLKIRKGIEKLSLIKEVNRLSRENEYLKMEAKTRYNIDEIVGESEKMKQVYDLIDKVANSNANILILGESGTGKELVARAIHYRSNRSTSPFVKINCSVYPEGLLESELFGHEKGAFSGALKSRAGRFEIANSGSIFIDEIGDVSPQVQVKLLRVLQEKEFERIGDNKTRHVDVRIIAATNKNLEESIKKGEFREDLFYRLNVISIHLPPLRDRKEDIPLLVKHFIEKCQGESGPAKKQKISSISQDTLSVLTNYNWPGNIRELENAIERAIVMSEGTQIELNDLPLGLQNNADKTSSIPINGNYNLSTAIEEYEKELIGQAFNKCNGIVSKAAEFLGIERNALRYKLKKYGFITILIASMLCAFFTNEITALDHNVKDKLAILWQTLIEKQNEISNLEKHQDSIENKSMTISERIYKIKKDENSISLPAGNRLNPLLKEIKDLSKQYTELQKQKSEVQSILQRISEDYLSLGNSYLKELSSNFGNSQHRDLNSNDEKLKEILLLESRLMKAHSLVSNSFPNDMNEDIHISIQIRDENDIDEITEDLKYLEDGINSMIKSLTKYHNELDYLYSAKKAKERMIEIIDRLQAGDRFSSIESINASNISKDVKEIGRKIEELQSNIFSYKQQLDELKAKSNELKLLISNLTGNINDSNETKFIKLPSKENTR